MLRKYMAVYQIRATRHTAPFWNELADFLDYLENKTDHQFKVKYEVGKVTDPNDKHLLVKYPDDSSCLQIVVVRRSKLGKTYGKRVTKEAMGILTKIFDGKPPKWFECYL